MEKVETVLYTMSSYESNVLMSPTQRNSNVMNIDLVAKLSDNGVNSVSGTVS